MKKILFLIIVQTLFKCGFSQNTDTIYLPAGTDSLQLVLKPVKGGFVVSEKGLESVFSVSRSLSIELALYRELIGEYDKADSLQNLELEYLNEVIDLKDAQISQYKANTAELNDLLDRTIAASGKVLQDNLKLRIRQRWMLVGGISIGLGAGLLVAGISQ